MLEREANDTKEEGSSNNDGLSIDLGERFLRFPAYAVLELTDLLNQRKGGAAKMKAQSPYSKGGCASVS